jgi:uncharacterized protein
MIRAVIDTNVVVSAFLNRSGSPAKVLDGAYKGKFVMLADEKIIEEYRRVLSYAEFKIEEKETGAFINFVLHNAIICGECQKLKDLKIPEDDTKFIEVADELKADFIITGNKKHFNFEKYHDSRIINPAEFIKLHP